MNWGKLHRYVRTQVQNLFPSIESEFVLPEDSFDIAVRRTVACIEPAKATGSDGFQYLNSGHYATFLYFLSRTVWERDQAAESATKLFLLNKALNGIDLFYEIEMPAVFLIGHTVGMVFAKARYGSHCVFHQGCTVGRDRDARPTIGERVILYPGAAIIGDCRVGADTVVTPGVQVINRHTPGNCLVFSGKSGQLVFKEARERYASRYFKDIDSNLKPPHVE